MVTDVHTTAAQARELAEAVRRIQAGHMNTFELRESYLALVKAQEADLARIAELESQVAALKPDAERYRWLSEDNPNFKKPLDAHIDAARSPA